MTRESYIEHRVKRWAIDQGILPLKMTPRGVRGYPDDFFFKNGKVPIMEFKAPGKAPEPLQKIRILEMESLGFEVLVCDDIEEGIAFLRRTIFG